ncbi:MAG: hypothetical protein OEY44_02990 [Candidatus Peregrinibacteria bacterium]|nr:hypothetical protein [Candidatus Peregrinibacteria bacterium]
MSQESPTLVSIEVFQGLNDDIATSITDRLRRANVQLYTPEGQLILPGFEDERVSVLATQLAAARDEIQRVIAGTNYAIEERGESLAIRRSPQVPLPISATPLPPRAINDNAESDAEKDDPWGDIGYVSVR